MKDNRIRVIAICVFRDGGRILVVEGFDAVKREAFYRPPGGAVEFGEDCAEALRREIREEFGSEIADPRLLGVLENRFVCDGKAGHEIVFVYDAQFPDRTRYEQDSLSGREDDGVPFTARWLDLAAITPDTPPVYPDGISELLANAGGG